MQAGVLERDDGLAGEGLGGHPLLDVEVGAVEAQTPEAAPAGGQLELELLRARKDVTGLDHRAVLADHDATVCLRRLDGRLDDHAPELVGIECGSKRVAEADVRLA